MRQIEEARPFHFENAIVVVEKTRLLKAVVKESLFDQHPNRDIMIP